MTEAEKFFLQDFEIQCKNLTIEELKQKYFMPLLPQYEKIFKLNIQFMSKYPFLLNKNFIPPEENRYLFFHMTDDFAYKFDKQSKSLEKLEINSVRETKYFFKDLSKPLLLEAEFNKFNLQFLSDTVRDSRDFAGDNHIYIKYTDMDEFSLLLYYVDMKKICASEKFVFIMTESGASYHIDFKKDFGIDYESMTPTRLRIEEMNRIAYWWKRAWSGAEFGLNVLNKNPDIIAKFHFFGAVLLQGHSICSLKIFTDFLSDLTTKYSPENILQIYLHPEVDLNYCSDFLDFVRWLKREYKTKNEFTLPELFRAYFIFLFYFVENSASQKKINPRIVPVIIWEPHTENGTIFEPLMMTFKYYIGLNSTRNPIIQLGRVGQAGFPDYNYYTIAIDMNPQLREKYYSYRFEDLKMYPEETCRAICEVLNVPYDSAMLEVDAPQKTIEGTTIHGFDMSPLHRNLDSMFSEFDKLRLKIFFDIFLKHFGYEDTFNFEECPINENDMFFLLKFPFRFEKKYAEKKNKDLKEIRAYFHRLMFFTWKLAIEGKIVLPKVIKPLIKEKNK